MTKDKNSRSRVTRWLRWAARIWSFPIILYALLVAAGYAWNLATTGAADPHAVDDYPPIEALPPVLMFLSILGLGVAWRWEGLGGAINVTFFLADLGLYWAIRGYFMPPRGVAILSLAVAPGILFLLCGWRAGPGRTLKDT